MARLVYSLTDSYQMIAAGRCIVSLGGGICKRIFINESASDTAAINTITEEDFQLAQIQNKPTYARLDTGLPDGAVKLIVDTE